MVKSKLKLGFTLVELMVFFVFISILLAASTPIITKRVKNLPLKVYHGKYMCYRNADGELFEEYYNASIRVKDPTAVVSCHFNPPKKANLYKIEMVGGGAGGYEYYGEPNERILEDETRSIEYHIGSGMISLGDFASSRDHIIPDGAQLRRIFDGAAFRVVSPTVGQGGPGGNVDIVYAPFYADTLYIEPKPEYKYIRYTDETTNRRKGCISNNQLVNYELDAGEMSKLTTEQQEVCNAAIDQRTKAANKLGEMYAAALNAEGKLNFFLYNGNANNQAINALLDYETVYNSMANREYEARGAAGGKGGYLTYNGKIDFKDYSKVPAEAIPISGVDSYLKSFPNHFSTGSVSAPAVGGACHDFRSTPPPTRANAGKNEEIRERDYVDKTVQAGNGSDIERYGALRLWNNWCVSNAVRATGGEGAIVQQKGTANPQHFAYNIKAPEPGIDASGIVGNGSLPFPKEGHNVFFSTYQPLYSAYPTLMIYTNLHKVTHTVGNGGTPGNVKTVYVTSLRDDCQITLGEPGPTINSDTTNAEIAELEEKLATKLSCNDNTINHRVEGGKYQKTTFTASKSEFDYVEKYKANEEVYSWMTTGSGGAGTKYHPMNIFTRYPVSTYNFGAAGKGSTVIDNCMKPQGNYKHILKTMDGVIDYEHTEKYDFEPFVCKMDDEEYFKKEAPGKGVGGAIIIYW